MSIGVLQGTTSSGELIQAVFEAYYKSNLSAQSGLIDTLIDTYVSTSSNTGSYLNSISSSNFRIMTIDNFQRGADGRWATHEIIGAENKPRKEFLGPGLEQITFSVFLLVSVGVTPEVELTKLRKLRDTGTVCEFILGNKPLTDNSWVISSLSEDHQLKNNKGQTLQAAVNVTLNEYVKEVNTNG